MSQEQLVDRCAGVDTIVHLAAEAYADRADEDPVNAMRLNVVGTTNVLAAARKLNARVVYGSTIWVYGSASSTTGDYDEEAPFVVTAERHVYTSSKLAGELVTRDFVSAYGLNATILRFGIPFGSRMREEAVLPRFCRAVLQMDPIELADGGRQGRQFIDVRDLTEGVRAAVEAVEPGPVYNLVSDEFVTIAEVAKVVMSVSGRTVPIVHCQARRGDFSPERLVSPLRAERDLGWRTSISFTDGVRDYWHWFCSNEELGNEADIDRRDRSPSTEQSASK
jgi:UDP-glucose 4-epimerase